VLACCVARHRERFDLPIGFGLQRTGSGRPWIGIINEGDAMADEHVIFDVHPSQDKSVAGNLAAAATRAFFLDLDKCADLGVVADLASVQVDELGKLDVPTVYGGCYTGKFTQTARLTPACERIFQRLPGFGQRRARYSVLNGV